MMRILFATDGSPDAGAAASLLQQWPLAGRAAVTVMTVIPPLPLFSPEGIGAESEGTDSGPQSDDRDRDAAARTAEAAAAALKGEGSGEGA